jgi:hypothetical protein
MTSPEEPIDVAGVAAEELIAQARRLGIVWTLIPGTVSSVANSSGMWPASNTWVVQDNDTNPTRAMSLIGPIAEDTRVMIMHVPPQGNYIIGVVGEQNAILRGSGQWIDYGTSSTIWTSTGTQPSIGNGVIVARYTMLGTKTCAFRIKVNPGSTTTFGTGEYQFLLPFPIADEQVAVAMFRDNDGADEYGGFTAWLQNSTQILRVMNSANQRWGPNIPVLWESGDRAEISGVYEIA